MKSFIKDNPFLCAGIALPIVLVLLVLLSRFVANITVPDPRYKVIFTCQNMYERYCNDFHQNVFVDSDQKLTVTPNYFASEGTEKCKGFPHADIYIYDGAEDHTESYKIVDIPKLSHFILSAERYAPDGYSVVDSYRNGSWPFRFQSNPRNTKYLQKGSKLIPLPFSYTDQGIYPQCHFKGWVIGEETKNDNK